ncbi:hypothetical protein E1262_16310 [Jiangella aurantiaca]|uniref:Uncharacterized protein n=1 Tax=Jiangella aurantiaca TaxID=2530373 RepID=A0A4R5AEM9_9ACTN|nr:hypothetical protein [Jiangella aurantiaca]TDD68362.1 hypothetical protein E1262_16310 [Jiangella aurantiaca]
MTYEQGPVAAKAKLATFARTKGLLTDTDFQREDAREFWNRVQAANVSAHSPRAVDIHDHDARDKIYGWDWDGTDGYFVTDPDPTDAAWHPA